MGTAKICESLRFTREINCLRAPTTGVIKIFGATVIGSGGLSGARGKMIFAVGWTAGTLTGVKGGAVCNAGVKSFPICVTDFAHSGTSTCLSVRTSSAGGGVRGLESPGLQNGSAALHVARHDDDEHHAQLCVYLHGTCLLSPGQLRPLMTLERQMLGNLLLKATSFAT